MDEVIIDIPKCPNCNKQGGVILVKVRIWDRLWGCLNCMKMFITEIKQEPKSKVFVKETTEDG